MRGGAHLAPDPRPAVDAVVGVFLEDVHPVEARE